MKTFLEISVSATGAQRDILLAALIESGVQGFQETDTHLIGYVDKSRWDERAFGQFRTEIHELIQTMSSNAEVTFRDVEEINWNEEWEKTLKPVEVGSRIAVKPSWTEYDNVSGRIVIEIDPKMSFGTGYHETTRLTLLLLETYVRKGDAVLDVGTGTGILAIAAIKLGARSAIGIDNDEWSIDNATENIRRNGVEDRVEISDTPTKELTERDCDIITANLTLGTNSELLPQFRRLLKPGGILLLSGLLTSDKNAMLKRLGEERFNVVEIRDEGEWIAIAASRSE